MSEIEVVPFNIPAFVAKTLRLNTEAKGAYLMLLLDYYQNQEGCLIEDDIIMEVTGLTETAWKRHKRVIWPLFEVRDGRLYHQRCEDEIKIIEVRRLNGKVAGRRSAAKRATNRATRTQPEAQPEPQPEVNQTVNQTPNQTSTNRPTRLQPNSNQPSALVEEWLDSDEKLYPDTEFEPNGNQTSGLVASRARADIRTRAAVSKKEESKKERKPRFASLRGEKERKNFGADAPTRVEESPSHPPDPPRPKPRLVVSTVPRQTGPGKGFPIPPDWQPNATHAALCASHHVDLADIEGVFRDYCAQPAGMYRYVDHDAGFRTFIRNQKTFNRGPSYGQTANNRSLVAAGERAISELDRQIGEIEALEGGYRSSDAVVQVVPEK